MSDLDPLPASRDSTIVRDELPPSHEELTTLNDELQRRNIEVSEVSADLTHFSLAVDIAILRIDTERRIRRFTPKARSIFNISVSDIGRVLDDVVHNLALPDLTTKITHVIESRTVVEFEVEDLAGRWHRIHIRPYTTTGEHVEGAIVSLVDIHELKRLVGAAERAQAEAERASSINDDFLATLSHELRTPLSSMLLNAQRLREGDILDQADLKRAGDSLERAVQLQARLIDDLLDASRIASGKLTLECRAFDLCELVRAIVEGMNPVADAKQLHIEQLHARGLQPIWGDPTRTQQIIANLLSNAIKFTPRLGRITMTVDAAEGVARVRITDTGIGISPDFLPRAFTHFAQSDRSVTRAYGGLGLGLALVRHLVEMQGGSVHAHSPGVGRGATFTVTFPFARARDAPETDQAKASALRSLDRAGRMKQYEALVDVRVLFIDDDFRTREAVLEVLELTGAHVALAASAADGMMALETFDPHVVVCDIAMPGEDGYAFIRKLRARELGRGAATPVLALTALASVDDKRRALAAGFQLHLAKPIDIARLRDSVLELVSMRTHAQKELTAPRNAT